MAREDYHYEICGVDGAIIADGYVALDRAIEYALGNEGFTINRIWLPTNDYGQIDFEAEAIASETVWKKPWEFNDE